MITINETLQLMNELVIDAYTLKFTCFTWTNRKLRSISFSTTGHYVALFIAFKMIPVNRTLWMKQCHIIAVSSQYITFYFPNRAQNSYVLLLLAPWKNSDCASARYFCFS